MLPTSSNRYAAAPRFSPAALLVPLLVGLLALAGCSSTSGGADKSRGADAADGEAQGTVFSQEAQQAYAVALTLMDAQDYASAAESLAALCAELPTVVGPRVNLAIALTHEQRYDEAQAVLLEAIALRDTAVEAWNQLGMVYRYQGRFLSARDAYAKALEIEPDYALAHYNAAVLFDLYLHQYDQALSHYQQYRSGAVDPDPRVDAWITDLERRVQAEQRTAGVIDEDI